jgi:hypothetical protein
MTKRKMSEEKKQRLREAFWNVGSVADFLKLSPEEQEKIEKRLQEERKK